MEWRTEKNIRTSWCKVFDLMIGKILYVRKFQNIERTHYFKEKPHFTTNFRKFQIIAMCLQKWKML